MKGKDGEDEQTKGGMAKRAQLSPDNSRWLPYA